MIATRVILFLLASYKAVAFRPMQGGTRSRPCHATELAVKLDGKTISGDIVPKNNFILVRKDDPMDATEGGVLLTGKARTKRTQGIVVSAGPGRTHDETGTYFPMPVTVGQSVMYGKFDGQEIDLDGVKHTLIRDDDVLLVYEGSSPSLETANVIRDNVLVKVDKKEEDSVGGILLAKSSDKKKPSTGEVIKVGPGRQATNGEMMAMEVQAGDFVKFRDFVGISVELDDVEYSIVPMMDVLAKY